MRAHFWWCVLFVWRNRYWRWYTISEFVKILPRYRVKEANQKIICKKQTTKKTKTTEQYKQELEEKHIDVIPLEDYIGANIPINHKFPCGHINKVVPSSILIGSGCLQCKNINNGNRQRKTTSQYQKEVELHTPNIIVLEEYINARIPILHKFSCGHSYKISPTNALKSNGCKICNREKPNPQKTSEQYKEEISLKNPKVELIGDYIGAKIKSEHKCKICGHVWLVAPTDILSGNGCPKCVGRDVSFQEFLEKFEQTGDKNLILTGNYINLTTKIDGYCKVCGYQISIEPNRLLKGVGCRHCKMISNGINKRNTHKQFILKMKSSNPSIKIIGKYITSHDIIKVQCLSCGYVWEDIADTLLRARCPNCQAFKLESIVRRWLDNNDIYYKKCKKYNDLVGVGGGKLSYDFYLPKYDLLIECQGGQHEHPIEYFGGIKKFIKQKIHDTRKRKYAHEHNINLLEIWYYENNKIDKILTQTLNNLKSESLTTAG